MNIFSFRIISIIVLICLTSTFFPYQSIAQDSGSVVPGESTVILSGTNTQDPVPNNKPDIPQAPSESTIFINDNVDSVKLQQLTKHQTYYSDKPIEFDITKAKKILAQLDKGIQKISDQIADLDKQFSSNDTNYRQTRKEVMNVINNMLESKHTLENKIDTIIKYKRVMMDSAQQINIINNDVVELKDYIKKFTAILYQIKHRLYNDQGEIDNIKLFMETNKTVSYTLSNTYMVEKLTEQLMTLLTKLDITKQRQSHRIKTSNKYKVQTREDIAYYQSKLENLEEKRKYLEDYLDLYKHNKNKIEYTANNLFDTRKDVQSAIMESIQEITKGTYVTTFDMKEKMKELSGLEPYATYERSSEFSWPILPVSKISSYFKDETYKKEYDLVQYGIELPTPQGTPIYATNDAVVYTINEQTSIGVNRAILVHPDKTITVYEYMNEFLPQAGDIVRRGQLIGYSGGEPGTKGAGFISKQPNLTIMIYKNGRFIDPLSLLDLSIFANKSMIDKKYYIKYLKDLYRRPRDIYKIAFMKGITLNQRRVEFLEKYGVGIYRELAFWQDASLNSNIDIDVGICIGFAESTLGNFLSTSNNIGNVGNNDRGNRISFHSALEGARLIYTTLNNQYLDQYNTIIELNGYGNKQGKIYASSPYNRQNNVVKCLSMIKGYYVPDDYPFRTGPVVE